MWWPVQLYSYNEASSAARRRQPKKRGLKFEIDNGLWAIGYGSESTERESSFISVHFHFKRHVHMTYM